MMMLRSLLLLLLLLLVYKTILPLYIIQVLRDKSTFPPFDGPTHPVLVQSAPPPPLPFYLVVGGHCREWRMNQFVHMEELKEGEIKLLWYRPFNIFRSHKIMLLRKYLNTIIHTILITNSPVRIFFMWLSARPHARFFIRADNASPCRRHDQAQVKEQLNG